MATPPNAVAELPVSNSDPIGFAGLVSAAVTSSDESVTRLPYASTIQATIVESSSPVFDEVGWLLTSM